MKIKEAKSSEEIKSLLLHALTEELVFTVWQRSDGTSVSFQGKAKILELSTQGILNFSLTETQGTILNEDIFFALEDTSLLFKSDRLKLKDDILIVSLPSEAKYKERRRHDRVRFKLQERKDIELMFSQEVKVTSQLIDISESGACFLVSKETLQKIKIDSIFAIKSLTHLKLGGERALIKNARKYKGPTLSQGEFYALGVMFI